MQVNIIKCSPSALDCVSTCVGDRIKEVFTMISYLVNVSFGCKHSYDFQKSLIIVVPGKNMFLYNCLKRVICYIIYTLKKRCLLSRSIPQNTHTPVHSSSLVEFSFTSFTLVNFNVTNVSMFFSRIGKREMFNPEVEIS